MSIFSNKEFEALQVENRRLADRINTLEVLSSNRAKSIGEMRTARQNAEEKIEFQNQQIKSLEEIIRKKDSEIDNLKRQLAAAHIHPHNERGAGRKRKATPEQTAIILSLRMEGKSYDQIARILNERFGEDWNKTTVRNTHIAAKN